MSATLWDVPWEPVSSYIALTFVAAQFINFFGYTKLGTILALKGAEFLETLVLELSRP